MIIYISIHDACSQRLAPILLSSFPLTYFRTMSSYLIGGLPLAPTTSSILNIYSLSFHFSPFLPSGQTVYLRVLCLTPQPLHILLTLTFHFHILHTLTQLPAFVDHLVKLELNTIHPTLFFSFPIPNKFGDLVEKKGFRVGEAKLLTYIYLVS